MKSEVWLGDNMEFMSTFPDKFFDLAIPDPPYGIDSVNIASKKSGKKYGKSMGNYSKVIAKDWDKCIPDKAYFDELFRVSKNQIIWGGNYFIEHLHNTSCMLVWDKVNGTFSFADAELAWTSFKSTVHIFKYRWNGMLQENMRYKEKRIHPTQKPVELYKLILNEYTKVGDKILDTHMGSQNSRIAAYNLGLDYWGCEIDKDYYKEGCNRFEIESKKTKLSFFPTLNHIKNTNTLF